jgi:riboflavin kinase/FMN adenylyltransferase
MSEFLARRELARIAPGRPCAVTIGVFDGVHRGHQYLVRLLLDRARQESLAAVAITFNPHPRTVLRPGTAVTYLTSLEERVELLQSLGIDAVAVLPFTSELAQLTAGVLRCSRGARHEARGPTSPRPRSPGNSAPCSEEAVA